MRLIWGQLYTDVGGVQASGFSASVRKAVFFVLLASRFVLMEHTKLAAAGDFPGPTPAGFVLKEPNKASNLLNPSSKLKDDHWFLCGDFTVQSWGANAAELVD